MEEMTGRKPNIFFRFCWLVVDPVLITVGLSHKKERKYQRYHLAPSFTIFFFTPISLCQVILIFSILQFKPARYGDYVFPPWAQGVGWVIALGSIIWIPLGAVHTLWVLPGSLMKVSSTPTEI